MARCGRGHPSDATMLRKVKKLYANMEHLVTLPLGVKTVEVTRSVAKSHYIQLVPELQKRRLPS